MVSIDIAQWTLAVKIKKTKFRKHVPQALFNGLLLHLPYLYRTPLIAYESHLYDAIDRLLEIALKETKDVKGNIIECGAERCGTSCLIAIHLKRNNIARKVFALDTFGEGFDKTELEKERQDGSTSADTSFFKHNSIAYVTKKIEKLGLTDHVIPVKGRFSQTLPTVPGPFSFAIIDCDLEKSTYECLEYVWPRISRGGLILIDDYANRNYKGVKKAVDRFLKQEKRVGEISQIRRTNRFEMWK